MLTKQALRSISGPGDPTAARPRSSAFEGIERQLDALARNMLWTWQPEVTALFRDLDPVRWSELDHNPLALLAELSPERIERRARELALHSRIHNAHRRMEEYLAPSPTWGRIHAGILTARPVAYFSAEFGIHESLPIYSGGLGVLAGDHIKSASDLGVPLVAVGLFYHQGFFTQRLDADSWQREEYLDLDVAKLPLAPVLDAHGEPILIAIETRKETLFARLWRVAVGRVTLLLLDSNVPGNRPEDRPLTSRLYGGDLRTRIRQEMILGIGGMRALRAVGVTPGVLHVNEGHSAFAMLEMARERMQGDGVGFDEACGPVAELTCFTTHTPVPAGHDRFPPDLLEEHLGPLGDALGLSTDRLLGMGRVDAHNFDEEFCMTVLALKLSRRANGVSSLHGHVSRRMWQSLWPARGADEVPIGHVTNGVHVHSWLAPQMRQLYDRHMGPEWTSHSAEPEAWSAIDRVDDGELWETHEVLKSRLIEYARSREVAARERRGESTEGVAALLDPEVLTIGFARRFATYKRATLLLHDLERLRPLLESERTPIQLLFAGKAHPNDHPGKELLQRIARLSHEPPFEGRVLFLEDYDINLGRHLVQGVDVWLNNPRRPLEASGTSGQKVVLNGGLNLSILDGWWAEAYDGWNGFAIGMGDSHVSTEIQDRRDAENLYRVLEEEVVPLYYARDADDLPRGWIARMKHSIRSLGWRFNADRMVMDYVRHGYVPAAGGLSCSMR